jgi:hypothetical protein
MDGMGRWSTEYRVRSVEIEPSVARDQRGRDLLALLQADDNSYYVMEKGDQAAISFPEPLPTPGAARSIILRARGYYAVHGF